MSVSGERPNAGLTMSDLRQFANESFDSGALSTIDVVLGMLDQLPTVTDVRVALVEMRRRIAAGERPVDV